METEEAVEIAGSFFYKNIGNTEEVRGVNEVIE